LLFGGFIAVVLANMFLGRVLGRVGGAAATGGLAGFLIWLIFSAVIAGTVAAIVVFLLSLFAGSQTGRHWSSGQRMGLERRKLVLGRWRRRRRIQRRRRRLQRRRVVRELVMRT
jgi:hypothetical protein